MTASALAQRVADAFNSHGKFTARPVEAGLAVEVRHVDTGVLATTLWLAGPPPSGGESPWVWFPRQRGVKHRPRRELPAAAGVDEVVRAVATSVLDEGRS